ncbi:T cell receptor alpha variable 12-2 [Chelydra serpentina]|nr:T cell receptor alpha variable 12-2 [Chelydra serpentina]
MLLFYLIVSIHVRIVSPCRLCFFPPQFLLYLFIVFSRRLSAPVLLYLSVSVFCSILSTEGIYGADSVTQTKGSVIISQGDPVRLNCTYQFSASVTAAYLFWYVHFPNQPPRLLLWNLGREHSDEGIRKGFNATHDKNLKSFHLWKLASELSDSATYYCAVSGTVIRTSWGAEQKPRRVCAEQRGGGRWGLGPTREQKGGILRPMNLNQNLSHAP